MTYAQFLVVFLGIPLVIFALANWLDQRQDKHLPVAMRNLPAWIPLLVHVLLAVGYTTPWDNYLVATGVWYYDPALVTGITLGWVPIEEYTFFVLQTLFTGLLLLWLLRRIPILTHQPANGGGLRRNATLSLGAVWLVVALLFSTGWEPATYLSLILLWALPPIMLQLAFGADILWRNRRLVILAISVVTLYLAATDSLAIGSGTWTIDPQQSLHILLAGVLPLEELLFFLVTNTLIVFGMVLALACESRERLRSFLPSPLVRALFNRQNENYS